MPTKKDFTDQMKQTHAPLAAMIRMVPDGRIDWAPGKGFMTVGQLIRHISENWCIVRMLVKAEWPFKSEQEMVEGMKLENIPSCSKAEALALSEKDLAEAVQFIEVEISEKDFFSKMVTAPWGFKGEVWKGVLMACEHFLNHKMQLHLYLKLLGLPVNTGTLYGP